MRQIAETAELVLVHGKPFRLTPVVLDVMVV
jgi:hypothetical protein